MKVLTWDHQRSRILRGLAGIDQAIASRTENIQKGWLTMRDAGHYIRDTEGAPEPHRNAPTAQTESSSVPEYLR